MIVESNKERKNTQKHPLKQRNREEYKPQVKQRCVNKAQKAAELVLDLLVVRRDQGEL